MTRVLAVTEAQRRGHKAWLAGGRAGEGRLIPASRSIM